MKAVTLHDVALLAEVSPATVSAVLRGDSRHVRVSEETKLRVQNAAERLNYRPNAGARAARTGRFGNVGLFIAARRPEEYIVAPTLHGVCDAAGKVGERVQLLIAPPDSSVERVEAMFREAAMDGIILTSSDGLSPAWMAEFQRSRLPAVFLNEKRPINSVRINDLHAGRILTEHLIAQGHRRIVFVIEMASTAHYSTHDRVAGYREAMRAAGLIPETLDEPAEADRESFARWVAGADRPALIAMHDARATHLLRVLYPTRLRAPRDFAVAGFNDDTFAELSPVPLTTIHMPRYDLAVEAHAMLRRLISGGRGSEEPSVEMLGTLVVRESSLGPGESVARRTVRRRAASHTNPS